MLRRQITILNNKEIVSGYFLARFFSPKIAREALPGQFLHIRCSDKDTPLLRRPFSIHRVIDNKTIEILYKVVGKGTHWLSQRKKGEKLDCLGPLGNGFILSENRKLLVAGGIGIAPLFFLAEQLAKTDNPAANSMADRRKPITVFVGAKTKNDILCAEKLKQLGAKVNIATEDGSSGYKGLISDLLKNNLSSDVCSPRLPNPGGQVSSVIYACGPKGMLKEVALLSKKYKISCQVSFEQFMGCGIGICNACVIMTKHGYKRVCQDGPVFDSEEIDWRKI